MRSLDFTFPAPSKTEAFQKLVCLLFPILLATCGLTNPAWADEAAMPNATQEDGTADVAAEIAEPTPKPQGKPQDKPASKPNGKPLKAVRIEFHEDINPLSGALFKRRFEQAVRDGAEMIVIDIDSPGGYLSTTLELVRMIEEAKDVRTVAYISREAISGAAILALATDQIVMLPLTRIGDAGMIVMGEDSAFRYAPEKARSLLAQQLRDLATLKGRPPSLVEAMVDKDLVIFKSTRKDDGTVRYISDREWNSMDDTDAWNQGKVVREAPGNTFFTANAERAVELGVAEQVIDNPAGLAAAINALEPIPAIQPSTVDVLILVLNSSFVTWLLLVIGLIALVIELGMPGVGLGGLISILCFGLFFWSRFLGGTSGWFEVMLFVIGIAFVMLEVLVIPGVGIAGIGGGLLILFSLVMASRRVLMPESSRDLTSLLSDVGIVLAAFVGFAIGLAILARYLGELPIISRLALAPMTQDDAAPVASLAGGGGMIDVPAYDRVEVGDIGRTLGPLRPSGRIQINDDIIDVVTEGDFIAGDIQVRIITKQGRRIVVRQV